AAPPELRAGARLVAPEPRRPAARDSPRGPDPGHAVRRHAGRRDHAPDVAGRPRPRRGVVGGGARSGGAGSRDSAPDGQVEVVGAVRRAGRAAGARLLVGRRRVAGGAGAWLLVFAGDLGVGSATWRTLAYAAAAGLVCAMAAWLARQPRTFDGRPADYLPMMGALVLVVALTWGPLVAHLVRTSK